MSALIFTSIPPVRRLSIRNSNPLGNSDVTKIGKSGAVPCCRQAEVGFASLGVGIAVVIAFKARLPFRFATLIPPWSFSLGAAGGHIYQMIAAHNFSPGNVGQVLPIDILMPIIGFLFLWLSINIRSPVPLIAN